MSMNCVFAISKAPTQCDCHTGAAGDGQTIVFVNRYF